MAVKIKRTTVTKKVVLKLTFASLILWIYIYCSSIEWWAILHDRCETPENEMKALKSLAQETHIILEHFNLTHFPMGGRYSSYSYGQIKQPLRLFMKPNGYLSRQCGAM